MSKISPLGGRIGRIFRVCLALLPIFSLACGKSGPTAKVKVYVTYDRIGSRPRPVRTGPPPQVTAAISQPKINWADEQQLFTLTLTNAGDKPETVHAIVYASNEQTKPPRRAISPPTAYQWFELAGSKDDRLSAQAIEQGWQTKAFITARGGKMPYSWQATLKPGETKAIEASHNLDARSPHPATKGKKLAHVGFLEYRVWLFTPDGQCFSEQTVPAESEKAASPGEPTVKKTTTPPTEPLPKTSRKAEGEAARALRLARYYLENNKPDQARAKLQLVLDRYPRSTAETEAKELLAKVPEN